MVEPVLCMEYHGHLQNLIFSYRLDLLWTEIAEAGLNFHGICFGQGESIMAAFLLECHSIGGHK